MSFFTVWVVWSSNQLYLNSMALLCFNQSSMVLVAIWFQSRQVKYQRCSTSPRLWEFYHLMVESGSGHGKLYSKEVSFVKFRTNTVTQYVLFSSYICTNSSYSIDDVNSWSNNIFLCSQFYTYFRSKYKFFIWIGISVCQHYTGNSVTYDLVNPSLNSCNFFQIMILLYVAHIIIHAMWRYKIDPDNSAIPYLTALGDLSGSCLLLLAFMFLDSIGSDVGAS